MTLLKRLAEYVAGEFDNREQAIGDPVWFVHLRMWQRPVQVFEDDSITIFAEQSNVLQLDQPYRQRLMRLQSIEGALRVQYYAFQDPGSVKGGGQFPERLESLSERQVELLPGCVLKVEYDQGRDRFVAIAPPDSRCCFSYQNKTVQVSIGFEVEHDRFYSFDKGIDPETGQAIWGAMMGPYVYRKRDVRSLI
jgi:CpeT/CpcT family (DUF1001)